MRLRYELVRRWSKATAMYRGRMRSIRSPMKRANPNTAWTGLPSRSAMSGNTEWYARNTYTDASIRKIICGGSSQPALDAVVQWARPREMREQILHLVRQYAPPLEEDVFRVGRSEGHCDELHLGLLGRARSFLVIAAAAGRHNVGPDVHAALAERTNVIARQLT